MSSFEIILILVLILAGYYVFQIGKELFRKANAENEQNKTIDEQEIDITDDLVHFDVTEVDPSDIPVEDTLVKMESKNVNSKQEADQTKLSSIPILPFPMEVTKFHKFIKDYDPDNPNPELDKIVLSVSEKPVP